MSEPNLINSILESVLKEAMGLNISSVGPSSLKHAINRRMRVLEMENTLQYLNLIKTSTPELNELIEEVAVNETWFFRDEAPFIALRDFASSYYKHNRGQALRLLSIPCSTGEEPYSMAISLIEAGIPAHSFAIDAVDISRRSLAIAQQGIYRNHSFRGPQAQRHQGFFTKTRQGYALDRSIKGLVRFHRGNLIHLGRPLTNTTYQVIFCRNLLIYLDPSFHQQAINTFDSLLADNGLLFIGHAEAGIFSGSSFTPAPYPKAFAFHKRAKESAQTSQVAEEGRSLHSPATSPLPRSGMAPPGGEEARERSGGSGGLSLFQEGRGPRPDRFEQEVRACEEQLRREGPSAETFYRLATLFEQKKEWKTAIKMLKKATYLDPNHIEAIDMLAAIYQRLGDDANYQACLNRGRRIITRLTTPSNS